MRLKILPVILQLGRAIPDAAARVVLILALACDSLAPVAVAQQAVSLLPEQAVQVATITGNAAFTETELKTAIAGQLQEIGERGMTPARADDAAYYLGAFYRKRGYAKADVRYEVRGNRVLLRIAEGPRTLLRRIEFAGNAHIPSATLFEYMIGATAERLEREPEQFPFTTSEIQSGAERVRGLYASEGYLDASVDASAVTLSDGGTRAAVTVKVTEGRRSVFGDIRFDGEGAVSREELLQALGEKYDGPFSPQRALNMQRNLQSFYKSRGYLQATIAMEADAKLATAAGRVPVRFVIKPDGLFRFDGTRVTNENGRLRKGFLPNRFRHLSGEVYDPAKLDETYREMLRTGLFRSLRVNATPIENHEARIDILAEEAAAREVGFTIGYGSYEGATVGLRLGDRNLFGNGRPLSLGADWSQRGLRGELLYVDPWLFETRFALRARLYSVTRDEDGYSKGAIGGRLDLTRQIFPHLELGAFVQAEHADIRDVLIDPPESVGPTAYTLLSAGLTASYDRRDDPINTTRGYIFSGSFEYSLLDGEAAFTRGTLRFSWYQPIGRHCLLAIGARAGVVWPIVDPVPIDQRFFNGGGTTVRSFAERDLGPRDRLGHPLGGEFYTVGNVEFTFPLVNALEGAVFFDAGNLVREDDSGFGEMRYAIGLGLRYKLPVGPLRIDYGLNPDPKRGEDRGAFHLSFGFAF